MESFGPDATFDVDAWLEEFGRLVSEAAERFHAGMYRPALASLAAIPPVHRVLVAACGELLNPPDPDPEARSVKVGLYL